MFVRPRTALLTALACLAGMALTCVLAYLVPAAQAGDEGALNGYVGLAYGREDTHGTLVRIVSFADPQPYAYLAALVIGVALVRRRYRLAALIPVVVLMAPLTTQALKHVLGGSWPSGHATASMTLALCGVLAAPQLLRPLTALAGGAFTLAISYSMLMLQGHFPSDIVGGYFCAGAWVLLAVAILRRWEGTAAMRSRPLVTRAEALPAATFATGALASGAVFALEQPRELLSYVADRPSFALSAIAIAGLAVVLSGALAGLVREPVAR